jgi:hypothetical protein
VLFVAQTVVYLRRRWQPLAGDSQGRGWGPPCSQYESWRAARQNPCATATAQNESQCTWFSFFIPSTKRLLFFSSPGIKKRKTKTKTKTKTKSKTKQQKQKQKRKQKRKQKQNKRKTTTKKINALPAASKNEGSGAAGLAHRAGYSVVMVNEELCRRKERRVAVARRHDRACADDLGKSVAQCKFIHLKKI